VPKAISNSEEPRSSEDSSDKDNNALPTKEEIMFSPNAVGADGGKVPELSEDSIEVTKDAASGERPIRPDKFAGPLRPKLSEDSKRMEPIALYTEGATDNGTDAFPKEAESEVSDG